MGLKSELIIKFIAVIAITTLISCFMGTLLINKWTMGQAENNVRNALSAARYVLYHRLEGVRNTVYFTSSRNKFLAALSVHDRPALQRYLEKVRKEAGLDILNVIDRKGNVMLRAGNPGTHGDNLSKDAVIGRVLASGKGVSSLEAWSREAVAREGREVESRCAGTSSTSGPAAMVLVAASPIVSEDGRTQGVLCGAELLNRNDAIVDRIRDVLYKNEKYRGKDVGGATLFLGPSRISTTFTNADGTRGFGSAVSSEVSRAVLGEGRLWVGEAPVIHSGYVAAYEPLRDMSGQIIGMLAVGTLGQKFADMRRETLTIFLGISLFGVVLAIVVASFFSGAIVKPINALVRASHKIAQGDFSARVGTRSASEIGELEIMFNLMASSLDSREQEIARLNEQRMMRSEKLASIGRLAAGIAHEINNPLTSVLTFSCLLLKKGDESLKEKLEIIVKETTRCREIVKGLLCFARQNEPRKTRCNLNTVIENALSLAGNQLKVRESHATVRKDLGEIPELHLDPNQMTEVFVNLIINAIDALPAGGELSIATGVSQDGKSVDIRVADTGLGISKEDLEKVFEPFFTTKEPGKGTGLGLAVAYGIIDGHNGSINVESEAGKGTTFVIKLPLTGALPEARASASAQGTGA
jgi:two-component system NtrC family sensor kinase